MASAKATGKCGSSNNRKKATAGKTGTAKSHATNTAQAEITTQPTSNRPQRAATKRRYTDTDFDGYGDEFDEEDWPAGEDEDGTIHAAKKRKTSHTPATKPFPFMSLPAELRNQIYELALVDEHEISIIAATKRYRRVAKRDLHELSSSLVPALLSTNHAILAETAPLLYGQPFIFEDNTALHHFLAQIGPRFRPLLADLSISTWGFRGASRTMNHPAFTLLSDAVNLQRLRLKCNLGTWNGPIRTAELFYRTAHYWLEAVGAAKRKPDAGVDVLELGEKTLSVGWRGRYPHWGGWRCRRANDDVTEDGVEDAFRGRLRELLM